MEDQPIGPAGAHGEYHPRIGTERFNYELLRHEILLEGGWTSLPLGMPGHAPPPGSSVQIQTHEAELTRENIMLRSERDAWQKLYGEENAVNTTMRAMLQPSMNREGELLAEITRLKDQLWLPREVGDHPYHGPTKPDPDTGRPVPVPDPVHERFHGSIGDVIAGNVMPEARRQMQEALKTAPKAPTVIPTTPSTDDPRRLGSEWLARLG